MSDRSEFEHLLADWERCKRISDELSHQYIWSTVTTPFPAVPETQDSLTAAALQHIAQTREKEAVAWQALADYLGRHNPKETSA